MPNETRVVRAELAAGDEPADPVFEPTIACHLGVGSTPLFDKERVKALVELAIAAVDAGYQVLCSNRPWAALDAVETTVKVLEASGIVNAGLGAVRQADGVQRCDASIMDGNTLRCGAVSSLEGFKHPVSVARRLLDFSIDDLQEERADLSKVNFYFCGYLIEDVFAMHGEEIPDEWRVTNDGEREAARSNGKSGNPGNAPRAGNAKGAGEKASPAGQGGGIEGDPSGDTVGAVAMDSRGNLAAATSTGGTRGSLPGRIGDTPVIGAGTYANRHAAVSNTGRGENVMKICGAKRVCDLVHEQGLNASLAVNRMHQEYRKMFPNTKGRIGTIAIDYTGHWTVQFTGARMTWAVKTPSIGYFGQNPGEKREF